MLFLHFALQLNLRHIASNEILIYPGYAPEPGVKYRVFHYGLEFSVGNWSFDKANWRNVDMVNRCWAKFPDPPDPFTLEWTDKNTQEKDLLSIECARTLNEALRLHHDRRKCPDPSSLSNSNHGTAEEATISRKFGKFNEDYTVGSNHMQTNHSQESTKPTKEDGSVSSLRFWMVVLWVISGLGFLSVTLVLFSSRKGKGTRGKNYRNKRRTSYSAIMDMNGRDRHIRNTEVLL